MLAAGHQVIFVAYHPQTEIAKRFRWSELTPHDQRLSRLSGGLNLMRRITRLRPDAVQICSIELVPLGLALKLLTGMKIFYDCREDNASAMFGHRDRFSTVERYVWYYAARTFEYLGGRFFDGLIVSDPAVYQIHSAARPERKMIFYNTPPLRHFRGEYGPLADRPYDLVMMGSMTPRSGVLPLIEAIGILKRQGRSVKTLLLGEPDEWIIGDIERHLQQDGTQDDVTITGQVPHLDVPNWLSQAKIGAVPLKDLPKFRNNIACKAFEYMACGLPVVSSDLPPERHFIREGETGLFVKPADPGEFARAIASLLDDLPRAQALGDAGRRDVERCWHCEHYEEKLRRFYERRLGRKGQVG